VANEAFDDIEAEGGSVADVATGECGGDSLARQAVIKLFDDTRKRLVETGTRNRLVHVNRTNTRGNVLNVVNERSDDWFSPTIASVNSMKGVIPIISSTPDLARMRFRKNC
jgi:hypothetical protein